jgi:hypothetical protein
VLPLTRAQLQLVADRRRLGRKSIEPQERWQEAIIRGFGFVFERNIDGKSNWGLQIMVLIHSIETHVARRPNLPPSHALEKQPKFCSTGTLRRRRSALQAPPPHLEQPLTKGMIVKQER